jgi:uncharacterized protein YjiS (DUF1127 family)
MRWLKKTKLGGLRKTTASHERRTKARIIKVIRAAASTWRDVAIRRSARDLDRLDDRLLKDVGLFREHLPSGATHVRRR